MYHLRKGISHTFQPREYNLNFLSILTLKVLRDKCDSNHKTTLSKNPVYLFFKEVFHDLMCQKICVSQLILNPCTCQIQSLCLFCELIMLNKSLLKIIYETLNGYLCKIFFLFKKFSVWLWITFSVAFGTSCKSEMGW